MRVRSGLAGRVLGWGGALVLSAVGGVAFLMTTFVTWLPEVRSTWMSVARWAGVAVAVAAVWIGVRVRARGERRLADLLVCAAGLGAGAVVFSFTDAWFEYFR